jgi:hypothetical protein
MLVVESALPEAEVAVREKQLSGFAFGIPNANRRASQYIKDQRPDFSSKHESAELQLDPRKTALALIHMRNGIVGMKTAPHSATQVAENSKNQSKPSAPTVRPSFMSAYRSDAKASAVGAEDAHGVGADQSAEQSDW